MLLSASISVLLRVNRRILMKKIAILIFIFSFLFANNVQLLNNLMNQISKGNPPESANSHVDETSEGNDPMTNDLPRVSSEVERMTQSNNPVTHDTMTTYVIEPGDVLQIDILGEEELSRTLVVWHNGNISFPLIGEFKVAGLTTEQAAELISEKLKKYYTHPIVSVILKSPTLAYVSVYGEVLRPGTIEYQRGFRITDYIALAGGPKGTANLTKVKVVKFQTENPIVTTVNVDDILNKGFTEKNFELKSGDWVYVSKKFTFPWGTILQVTTLTLTALNLYITINRLND